MTNGKQELEETMEVQFQPVFDKQTVPEGRAGHRAGGKATESTGPFRVPSRGSVRRREDGGGEVRRILFAGANAWRAVEGVMADRRNSKILKGKVMSTCVTPAYLYGTETWALTGLQQQRLQVCENNWVRKNSKSNEGRQAKNGGVKGRDGSAEELGRETGEEHITVGWTRIQDGG